MGLPLVRLSVGPRLPWLIIAVGIALRLVHYLHNCSLSVDESLLALNVLARTHAALLEPLSDGQGAPLLFLLLLRSVVDVLGESEYALRLTSLVCGVVSLFLFRSLARRYLPATAVPIAVGLFAISDSLIFYSAQVKQYSGDVMFALVLYWMADRLRTGRASWWFALLFGLVGSVALGFSHPAVFVLAGIAISSTCFNLLRPAQERRFGIVLAAAIWGATFLLLYWLSLRKLAGHEWLLRFWEDEFMPFPPTSPEHVRWYVTAFFQMFSKGLGFSLQGICALTFLAGVYSLFSSDRERLGNLVLPILLALGASSLQLYPFCCRLILFAAPALLLLMAEGAVTILSATQGRRVIGTTLVVLLFLHPVMWAGYHVVRPRYEEEIKPELEYLKAQRQPGDVIYVYYGAKPAFTYYARRFGWDVDACCIIGARSREDWHGYERDLARLAGHDRVWFVFAHVFDWKSVDERVLFLQFLDNLGRRLDGLETQGAALYLYDLRPAGGPEERAAVEIR